MTNAQYDSAALDWLNGPMVTLANRILPFYRRHPYHGQLWLAEIDMRIAVCPSHRFVYNRLPKNANSTVTASLVRAVRGRDRQDGDVKDKWFFQRPSRAGRKVSANVADFTKIVFVRDPVSRTLSAYRDKIAQRKRPAKRPLRWLEQRNINDPSFEDFCRYLDATGLHDDNHWAPQTEGLIFPYADFDFVGRFENLNADLAALHQRLFGAVPAEFTRAGPPATGASNSILEHYTPTAAQIIARLYAKDFETLGYDPAASLGDALQ